VNEYVKKREVFYISGYDPRGARHYHNLYKEELAKQCKRDNLDIRVSKRSNLRAYQKKWIVFNNNEHQTTTNYYFLEWDDIIKKGWKKSLLDLYIDVISFIKTYLLSGLIFKFLKESPVQIVAGLYPLFYLLLTLFLAIFLYLKGSEILLLFGIDRALAYTLSLTFLVATLIASKKIGDKLAVFWLLRIYIFSPKFAKSKEQELNRRLELFATYIADSIKNMKKNGVDEILIVSHSVGTILTIPTLLKALDDLDEFDKDRVAIVTLGECIPLVSFQKEANLYRKQMLELAKKGLLWLDYTTPIDGACFPLLDFYKSSNVEVKLGKKPIYLSPRFHTLFSKESYSKIKKNRYLTHFIYLMATEFKGHYNFFYMSAGSNYLKDTYKG